MPDQPESESLRLSLREQLINKPGIFRNTNAHPLAINFTPSEREALHPEQFSELAILENLESRFENYSQVKGISTGNLPIKLKIATLKNNISDIEKQVVTAGNYQKQFSHLAIFWVWIRLYLNR